MGDILRSSFIYLCAIERWYVAHIGHILTRSSMFVGERKKSLTHDGSSLGLSYWDTMKATTKSYTLNSNCT